MNGRPPRVNSAGARPVRPRWRRWAPWALMSAALAGLAQTTWQWRQVDELNSTLQRGVPVPAPAASDAAVANAATQARGLPAPPAVERPPEPLSGPAPEASAAKPTAFVASAPARAAAPTWLNDGRPLAWRFGQALSLAAAGDTEAASARYRSLYDDPLLGVAARYNAANLLLRQGMALQEAGKAGTALPLIELAKEGYRQVLRQVPHHGPARYNLERAQRLLPEVDPDELPAVAPEHAERAVTTMRSVSQGLP